MNAVAVAEMQGSPTTRAPSLLDALLHLLALAILIASALALFGMAALDGPIQVALVVCCAVASLIALKNGHRWTAVQEAGQGALSSITSDLFILLAVGALIGTWNLSGTIPTLVYYGIQILSPGYFYVATAVICGVVALSIGSSWTTAGTIGVGVCGQHSYWVVIMTTASALFPGLGAGDTAIAVIVSSIGVWLFVYLILQGVKEAAVINQIATVAKIVPILVFIVIAAIALKADMFADNFWGGDDRSFSSVFEQAKGTMLITVFVFLGIEGASVYSRFARKREDVGRATIIGFLSVLSVFALVTLLPYGILPQGELAGVAQPSMASVLEFIVGPWGSVIIRVGVVLSVLGADLAWTLMSTETST